MYINQYIFISNSLSLSYTYIIKDCIERNNLPTLFLAFAYGNSVLNIPNYSPLGRYKLEETSAQVDESWDLDLLIWSLIALLIIEHFHFLYFYHYKLRLRFHYMQTQNRGTQWGTQNRGTQRGTQNRDTDTHINLFEKILKCTMTKYIGGYFIFPSVCRFRKLVYKYCVYGMTDMLCNCWVKETEFI